tara:strand:- start:569 stop:883 length:315 start_codon:yes stop_codon:yes gene_type:complete
MKQIINGKTYNTDTATLICDTCSHTYSQSDFAYEDSSLYVTKKGAYFIAGKGGPMSRFAYDTGNGTTGGSGIVTVSREEALSLAERHGNSDIIEQHFADMIEEA